MKLYVPFRKDNAVSPFNSLTGVYYEKLDEPGRSWLGEIRAFHRRKDAVEYMEDRRRRLGIDTAYKIVTFEIPLAPAKDGGLKIG